MLCPPVPLSAPVTSSTSPHEDYPVPGLESDEEGTRVVREELKLLATVFKALGPDPALGGSGASDNARPAGPTLAESLAEDDRKLLELRELAASAKPEDLPAYLEQMHTLGAVRAHRGKSTIGSIDRRSPYFAHLRLEETFQQRGGLGEKRRRRDVLIGGKQYLDAGAGVRIVDWRNAPVSRIFYRYRESDPYEETLGDQPVEGEVVARRTVAIVDGQLRKVTAPQGTFVREADGRWRRGEALQARLRLPGKGEGAAPVPSLRGNTTSADRLLPSIAAMLDKAQYDLITKPGLGLLAIQGSAGSGKTTVGLHRVAYLHASNPSKFRPQKMLVIVPNEALIHYTSRVLPGLGVEGVPVMTFARWSVRVVHDLFPRIPSAISDETPPLVSRVKNHPAMLHAIESVARDVNKRLDSKVEAVMGTGRWPDSKRVIAAWQGTHGVPDRRVTQLAQWISGKKDLPGVAPAQGIPEITRSAVESLGQELRNEARAVLGAWDELTTSRIRLDEFFGEHFGKGQLDQVHEWCVRQARIRVEQDRDGESPSLDIEDHALLMRLWQVMRGPLVDVEGGALTLAHLFIDEVQDASPIELKVMLDVAAGLKEDGRADPTQLSVTLAGDMAQRMREDDDSALEFDWDATLKEVGVAGGAGVIEPLQVSYRSTAEITSFARGVLGPLAHEAEPIATRHGPPVELFSFASAGEAVAFLADALRELSISEPDANVALLSRFPQQAEVYYEGLMRAEVPNVRRVRRQDFTWERGFDVTDVRQTKGLEFDEVILLETTASSYSETSQARHALYVGATRAAHQLWCIASETPSRLVVDALQETPDPG
ncbi:MAG: UvrD/Rep helicase family protein [Labilithrix sp.]|nr:UvrD/Rep helicase family protein [Labilithrix sp.]